MKILFIMNFLWDYIQIKKGCLPLSSFSLVHSSIEQEIQTVAFSLSFSLQANRHWRILCWCFDAYVGWWLVEALQKLPVKIVTEAWVGGFGDGGMGFLKAGGGRRDGPIPVNERNSQASLAKPYCRNTNKYNLTCNVPLPISHSPLEILTQLCLSHLLHYSSCSSSPAIMSHCGLQPVLSSHRFVHYSHDTAPF